MAHLNAKNDMKTTSSDDIEPLRQMLDNTFEESDALELAFSALPCGDRLELDAFTVENVTVGVAYLFSVKHLC